MKYSKRFWKLHNTLYLSIISLPNYNRNWNGPCLWRVVYFVWQQSKPISGSKNFITSLSRKCTGILLLWKMKGGNSCEFMIHDNHWLEDNKLNINIVCFCHHYMMFSGWAHFYDYIHVWGWASYLPNLLPRVKDSKFASNVFNKLINYFEFA